jgi:hypothetical protein
MAKTIDIYIDQGVDFLAVMPAVDTPSGTIVDLTNYTVDCQMRRSYSSKTAIQITATITNAVGGVITLSMANDRTGGLSPLHYVYDAVIISQSGNRIKVFDGLVIVNPGVTDKPNTNVVVPYLPDDFGGL